MLAIKTQTVLLISNENRYVASSYPTITAINVLIATVNSINIDRMNLIKYLFLCPAPTRITMRMPL